MGWKHAKDIARNLARTLLALFALSGMLLGSPEDQDSPSFEIKMDATLVNVPVIVTDSKNRYAPGLQASDFTLYENGTPQEI